MHTIDLAYAGHGIHEELVAYVADQEGYAAAGTSPGSGGPSGSTKLRSAV
jgi:hypothetical protein